MTDMDPALCKDEVKRARAWDTHLRIYQSQDRMLAQILEAAGTDALVVLVSDHGATPDGPKFDPYKALGAAGLVAFPEQAESTRDKILVGKFAEALRLAAMSPDPKRSKAIPQRSIYVYVNLKGRDPDGIVEPEEYERVQQEIIEALLSYRDPETGKRPVAMALPKKDARLLGLYGDRMGDVVYAVYPWFGSQHGQALPTAEWGVGSLRALLAMAGPGLRRGYRMERTAWLTDIVPTLCYLMDWPLPEQAEGAVLYQAFKDPNFKLKETAKLRDALARMETALARQDRQPWDKHDCA
jgi:arylsulfatase A-like enzyme